MPPAPPPAGPGPHQDRASPPIPENIARLLYVVSTLLAYGRHLAATIERRAAMPGFALFAALFGTARVQVILAHLHRGILRAAALEALLLKRAATGRDVTVPPVRSRPAPGANAGAGHSHDQLDAQAGRLAAGRARYDTPVDPDHPPTLADMEAEVGNRAYGRSIAAVCRDLGVIPGLCTSAFWDAVMNAIDFYDGCSMTCLTNMFDRSEAFQREQEDAPPAERTAQDAPLFAHHALGFKIGDGALAAFRDMAVRAGPRDDVPVHQHQAAAADATGPPPRAAMPLAA